MPFPDFVLAVLGILTGGAFLLSPMMIVRQILKHRERMAQIQNQVGGGAKLAEEITALRQEMSELRETTTRFDMAFDAALARVEDRLNFTESQANANTSSASTSAYPPRVPRTGVVEEEETRTVLRQY